MRFLFEHLKIVAEPTGASALAALLAGRVELPGQHVGVVISGGNIDAERFCQLLSPPQLVTPQPSDHRTDRPS